MAESRRHGNCLTAWLMEWSRAIRARRLPLLAKRHRRTRAESGGQRSKSASLRAKQFLLVRLFAEFRKSGFHGLWTEAVPKMRELRGQDVAWCQAKRLTDTT